MQRSTRHGELKGELRQKVEVTRLQLVMASSKSRKAWLLASHAPWRVQGEHNSPWRAYLLTRRVKAAQPLRADVAETH